MVQVRGENTAPLEKLEKMQSLGERAGLKEKKTENESISL